ncbi:MAG: hypothetical protein U9Q15_03150 [Patescibacteria group bacterium]|nr:hypothetical protein [Patescibacteria group bacterium]
MNISLKNVTIQSLPWNAAGEFTNEKTGKPVSYNFFYILGQYINEFGRTELARLKYEKAEDCPKVGTVLDEVSVQVYGNKVNKSPMYLLTADMR